MGKRSREKREKREEEQMVKERKPRFQFGLPQGGGISSQGLEQIYLFIIRWGTYLVLFAPLVINTKFFFPFVAPKTTLFRILVEIILAAYLFLIISHPKYRPRINALTIAITLFLGVFILSSFAGINLERSFWSTYERMTGIWTMLHLFAFFIVLSSVFKRREDWEKILGVSIIVGVLLSLYVLKGDEISSRGGGTIGNTSFMAAYLLFDIFFAIILFLTKKGGWQIFSGISLAIMLPVLFTSSARTANAVFWVGIFLLGLGYLIFSKKKVLKRSAFGIILILVILASIALVVQPDFLKGKANELYSGMNSRFTVWRMGIETWQERPILGWGPENFNVGFNKHFNPCLFLGKCGGEIWFDRVHNIVFDILVTMGLVGLLSYLSIFGVAIWGLLRILPKVLEWRNIFLPLGMIVLLLIYFAQNMLVFDMINTYMMFFLCLAFINFLISKSREEDEVGMKPFRPLLGLIIIIIMVPVLWFGNIKPIMAGHYTVRMIGVQKIEDSAAFFQKSLDSWMEKYEPREHFAQKVTGLAYQSGADNKALQEALELAETEMEISCEKNSLDFRPHLFLGRLYGASYRFSGNPEKLKKAEEILEKAITLSPTNQQGYWHLAEIRLAQRRDKDAVALLQQAIDLEPELARSYWYLAIAYRITGNNQLALEKIIEAEERGYNWMGNLDELKKVIGIYLELNDDAHLVPLYQQAINLDPQDTQLWASLAASYANLGQFDQAREIARKMAEINPDLLPQAEEFLKRLPQ